MTASFNTLQNLSPNAKIVLVRADLNVPMQDGKVSDTTRLDRLVPTLRLLQQKNVKIVVLSHFGRPKGRTPEDSLRVVANELSRIMGEEIAFADECIGDVAQLAIAALPVGRVLVLENLRYHAGEEKNDPMFAAALAQLGDALVNDAFSVSHRAHASVEALTKLLPSYAGLLMQEELNALQNALEAPKRPVMAIVGGSKISTKTSVLENLVAKVDYLFLGGGMANTFLVARGIEVGKSLCERDLVGEAKRIEAAASASGCKIVLPVDRVVVKEFGANAPHETVPVNGVHADVEAVDIGAATIVALDQLLDQCKTVLWNGPMGVFEVKPFDRGTNELARLVAAKTKSGQLVSVAGGGDTVAALEQAGAADDFTYISSAGGAFLEWLEGKELPGVQALMNAAKRAA
jgi:phosphoglycerate kinase